MTAPLVSIIIPCFNGEAFVAEAIDSALAQSYPNVEVVVIDDGSTDGTLEVLRSFGDRIRWETGPNRGGCVARNRGVEIARGDLIQFLDADDLLAPEKIERTLVLGYGAEVAPICGWETILEDGDTQVRFPSDCGDAALAYALEHQIPTPTVLHHRTWFERVGGFLPALPCGQERDLHIRLAAAGLRFAPVREVLVKVRRQPGSVSSDSHRVLLQHQGTFLRAHTLLSERNALTVASKAALARAFLKDARLLVRHGDHLGARRYAQHARDLHKGGGLDAFRWQPARWLARAFGVSFAELTVLWVSRSLKRVLALTSQPR